MERKTAACILVTTDQGRTLFDYVLEHDLGTPYPLEERLAFILSLFTGGVMPFAGDRLEDMLEHLTDLARGRAKRRKRDGH